MSTEQRAPSPHLPVRPEWLALHSEPALEPGLAIIDAHHHLWDHAHNPYGPADLLADAQAGHRILATVFVECGAWYRTEGPPALASLGETESVQRIVFHAPLTILVLIVGTSLVLWRVATHRPPEA